MSPKVTFVACVLSLAGCDGAKDGTNVVINAGDGNVVAGMNGKTGEVAIDVPGFSGKLKLPKIRLDADAFDMNGVHLYPGSTIDSMNVDAKDGAEYEDDDGTVRLGFTSPADPLKVRAWFLERLGRAGFKIAANGDGLAGKTDEGAPFRLELAPAGAGRAAGTITIGGR